MTGNPPIRLHHLADDRALRLSGEPGTPLLRGWLHLGGLVIAVPAVVALVSRARSLAAVAVTLAYGVALVALFATSAAYHRLSWSDGGRAVMRRLDHATIYAYIAAAYTPICVLVVKGWLGWTVLAVVWTGSALGIAAKSVDFDRARLAGGTLYMVLGWLAVLILPRMVSVLDATELALVVAGGIVYTAGAITLAVRRPDPWPSVFGYHEVWHSTVLAASACYFAAVWLLIAR